MFFRGEGAVLSARMFTSLQDISLRKLLLNNPPGQTTLPLLAKLLQSSIKDSLRIGFDYLLAIWVAF